MRPETVTLVKEGVDDVATVMLPAPLVMTIFVPWVSAALTGAAPVLPIKSCPLVGAVVVVRSPPVPEYKKELAVNPDTVSDVKEGVEETASVIVPGG